MPPFENEWVIVIEITMLLQTTKNGIKVQGYTVRND